MTSGENKTITSINKDIYLKKKKQFDKNNQKYRIFKK